MSHYKDPFNEYNALPIVNSIEIKLRQQIVLLQVIPDQIRNYNILFITENNHDVYAAGDNTQGCLGLEHNKPVFDKPELVQDLQSKNIVQIATGYLFVIAISRFGDIYSWGMNTSGQLAQSVKCPQVNKPTKIPVSLPKSTHMVKVACGYAFAAVLTVYKDVFTFGDNTCGQLGLGSGHQNVAHINQICDIDKVCEISCGANHLAMLSIDHTKIYFCGDNRFGQLGVSTNVLKVDKPILLELPLKLNEIIKSISCGENHTLVLMSSGMIYSFGDNRYGQLGRNCQTIEIYDSVPKSIQASELFDQLFTINLSNISVAKSSSRKNQLYIWGEIKRKGLHQKQIQQWRKQSDEQLKLNKYDKLPINKDDSPVNTKNILVRPHLTYLSSVLKLFALYEPNCLTYSIELVFDKSSRKGSKIINNRR